MNPRHLFRTLTILMLALLPFGSIRAQIPVITSQPPLTTTVAQGESATLSVVASGDPLAY